MSNTNSSIVFVDTVDDLEQITQEHVQLAIWRRHAIPKFVQTVHQLSATATATDFDPVSCIPNFECIVQPEETYELLKAHLYCPYNLRSKQYQVFQDPELFELIRDIAGLVTVFATIAKTECVNIKLEVVTDNGCQYWHQDSVPQRMVVTYFGPCTEFIPPDDSITTNNNNKMGMTVLAQYRTTNICPAQYQPTSLTHYDVAVFKGRGATTEESPLLDSTKGIVHRSPRLFATNDDDEDEDDNENENDDDDENDGSDDNDHGTKNGSQSGTFRWVLVLDIPVEGWHYWIEWNNMQFF